MRLHTIVGLALIVVPTGCGTPSADPSARTASAGGSEPTTVRHDPPTPSTPALSTSRSVGAFLRFATGDLPGTEVPWGGEIAYSVEGTTVARLDASTASTRRAWDTCAPGTATSEGRSCPVNVLRAISDRDRSASPVVIDSSRPGPVLGCSRYRAPRSRATGTVLWLRPPQNQRDCFSDMAVAVTVSAADEIVAVDLALSGP